MCQDISAYGGARGRKLGDTLRCWLAKGEKLKFVRFSRASEPKKKVLGDRKSGKAAFFSSRIGEAERLAEELAVRRIEGEALAARARPSSPGDDDEK